MVRRDLQVELHRLQKPVVAEHLQQSLALEALLVVAQQEPLKVLALLVALSQQLAISISEEEMVLLVGKVRVREVDSRSWV